VLQINEAQRRELEHWAHSQALAPGDVFRARLILALAEGKSYGNIMRMLQTTAPTIARWKKRFEQLGVNGLDGQYRGSHPRIANAAVQAKIASLVGGSLPSGSAPRSYRKIAAELSLSKSTIQRICAQNHSKPHRLDRYMAMLDRVPEYRASNIIGLYLLPPQHAIAFSVGEPFVSLPGIDSLNSALDAGAPSSGLGPRHTAHQFTQFRDLLLARVEGAPQIHLVLDNASAHTPLDVELFLATHPRVHLHFLQSYGNWLKHADLWFSRIDGRVRADSNSLKRLRKYLRAYAKSALPFRWILEGPFVPPMILTK
jgi:hypothetical protein